MRRHAIAGRQHRSRRLTNGLLGAAAGAQALELRLQVAAFFCGLPPSTPSRSWRPSPSARCCGRSPCWVNLGRWQATRVLSQACRSNSRSNSHWPSISEASSIVLTMTTLQSASDGNYFACQLARWAGHMANVGFIHAYAPDVNIGGTPVRASHLPSPSWRDGSQRQSAALCNEG